MPIQSSLIITVILSCLVGWLLWNFFHKRVTAGQALFWLVLLTGGEILALFPGLVARFALLWGDLWPVSWITFCALTVVIFYLLYLTVRLNRYGKLNELARNIAFMERRLRMLETAVAPEARPGNQSLEARQGNESPEARPDRRP